MVGSLKAKLKQLQHSRFRANRLAYHACRVVWFGCRLLVNARLRSETIGPWRHRGIQHQRLTFTKPNRYPLLFEVCRRHCAPLGEPRLLSYGCSTGDEVFSLAERVPQAVLVGVDINEWCLAQCRRKDPQHRYAFHHRLSPEFASERNFDAILCLAVFQRSEHHKAADNSVAVGQTFAQFEQEISVLDGKLKPGGLFIIDHADFRFTDTACAVRYTPLDFPNNRLLRVRPLYGPDNRKLADQHDSPRVFVKRATGPE